MTENLADILEKFLNEENLVSALSAIDDNRYNSSLDHSCSDEFSVVFKFLTDENFKKNLKFYSGCEEILKAIARKSNEDEVLFELLEVIETFKSDNIIISALKGLQIALLNQKTQRSRSLEWCFNSIYTYVADLPFPEKIKNELEDDEAKLIEINENIERILSLYITIFLFLEPITEQILKTKTTTTPEKIQENFCNTENTKKNVIACFLLQLMGPPFAYLEIIDSDRKTGKSYTLQCAESLVNALTSIIKDPFFLLQYSIKSIEENKKKDDKNSLPDKIKNIFDSEEKTPTLSICIYFYLIFAENLIPLNTPKIYSKKYIFENCLFLVTKLLTYSEGSLNLKGIKFGESLINFLGKDEKIDYKELSEEKNNDFCEALVKISILSEVKRNRKYAVILLKNYIFQFNDEGRFKIIKRLLNCKHYKTLHGYLSIIYKDIIAEYLNNDIDNLPKEFLNENFKEIMIDKICHLSDGVTTDLMENADQIISALNIITFFIIRDKKSKTTIWIYLNQIKDNFLSQLGNALDFSKAHYKAEEQKIINNVDDEIFEKINLKILNDFQFPKLTKEQKLISLKCALNTFDIMESLRARAIDVIINANKTFEK